MPDGIARAWWFDGEKAGEYRRADAGRIFKWILFKKDGELQLAAMPASAGLDFHMQLLSALAAAKGWATPADVDRFIGRSDNHFYEAGIEVMGGGARLRDGSVRNYSYRFGAIPGRFLREVEEKLGIT